MMLFQSKYHSITPAAKEACEAANISPTDLLDRHFSGDFGTNGIYDVLLASMTPAEDETGIFAPPFRDGKMNVNAIMRGGRVMSLYEISPPTQTVWVITEEDRSTTTVLLPSEY